MSNFLFKFLSVGTGGVALGVGLFFLIDVGTASEPTDTVPVAAESTTSTTSTSSSTTTTFTATTLPPTTTTTVPPKQTLVIQGTGDVNLDPAYIPAFAENGYDHAWRGLRSIFWQDDISVINLECAATDGWAPEPKAFVFRCPTEGHRSIATAGVEVASLANNHGQDHGKAGMLAGKANLAAVGVAPVGVGENLAEASQPAIFEVKGWTVAVLGFGGVKPHNGWYATEDRPGMVDGDDIPTMVAAVEAAGAIADVVVVTIHWGTELDTEPRDEDIARAEAMIEAGADVIFGHHAHRLQPYEVIDDSAVFWGLGNFVWPNFSRAGSTTGVARAVIHPDGSIEACLIPAFIETPGQPVLTGKPECGPPLY